MMPTINEDICSISSIHMFIHVHKQKLSLTKIFIGGAILLLNIVLKTLF